MSRRWEKQLNPRLSSDLDDAEFLAERQPVFITPAFDMEKLQLIEGDFGPFKAGKQVMVPFWLALMLKKDKKCRITPPEWMNAETLTDILAKEQEEKGIFTKVCNPGAGYQQHEYHFMEISKLMLRYAEDDVTNARKIKELIHDIVHIRANKQRAGLKYVDTETMLIQQDNIGAVELRTIRTYICGIMDNFYKMHRTQKLAQDAQRDAQSVSQSTMGVGTAGTQDTEMPATGPVRKLRRFRR